MEPIQLYHTQLLVLGLFCLLFTASIPSVLSRDAQPGLGPAPEPQQQAPEAQAGLEAALQPEAPETQQQAPEAQAGLEAALQPEAPETQPVVDPNLKEICSKAKEPAACEYTFWSENKGTKEPGITAVSVLSAQMSFAHKACFEAATLSGKQEGKEKDFMIKVAYGTCFDELIQVTAKIVETGPQIFGDDFPDPLKDLVGGARAAVDNCISLAAAGEGMPDVLPGVEASVAPTPAA